MAGASGGLADHLPDPGRQAGGAGGGFGNEGWDLSVGWVEPTDGGVVGCTHPTLAC